MLRLWPERLYAGVFLDCGWIHGRGKHEACDFVGAEETKPELSARLDTLFRDRALQRNGRVELIVSDHFSRIVHLPWQDGLTTDAQRVAFARACFDRAGLSLDGEWLIQATYKHYAHSGIAYAFPRDLVVQVRDQLLAHKLKLASILPISGAAYWRHGSGSGRTRTVLLLEEKRRVSAMLFEQSKYACMHVQPIGSAPEEGLRRLINLVEATFPGAKNVQYWSTKEVAGREDMIKERLPTTLVTMLPTFRWH